MHPFVVLDVSLVLLAEGVLLVDALGSLKVAGAGHAGLAGPGQHLRGARDWLAILPFLG